MTNMLFWPIFPISQFDRLLMKKKFYSKRKCSFAYVNSKWVFSCRNSSINFSCTIIWYIRYGHVGGSSVGLLFTAKVYEVSSVVNPPLLVVLIIGFTKAMLEDTTHMKALYSVALRGEIEPKFSVEDHVIEFGLATGLYPHPHGVIANEIYEIGKGYVNAKSPEFFHFKKNVYPIWSISEL